MAGEGTQHRKFSSAKQTNRVLGSALFWVITQEDSLGIFFLDFLTLEDGDDSVSRNVGK
jgi:hypothetical protein